MSEALAWLREQIEGDESAARGLADLGSGHWIAVKNAGLDWTVHDALGGMLQAPSMADCWGEAPAQFIAGNDPQDVIARCEAELAILDRHSPVTAAYGPMERLPCCGACSPDEDMTYATSWPCGTVLDLASGYRHRPGYAEHWGEKATTS
jgi:Family of unknown function (DUF6221)